MSHRGTLRASRCESRVGPPDTEGSQLRLPHTRRAASVAATTTLGGSDCGPWLSLQRWTTNLCRALVTICATVNRRCPCRVVDLTLATSPPWPTRHTDAWPNRPFCRRVPQGPGDPHPALTPGAKVIPAAGGCGRRGASSWTAAVPALASPFGPGLSSPLYAPCAPVELARHLSNPGAPLWPSPRKTRSFWKGR